MMNQIKTADEIVRMRRSGQITAQVLNRLAGELAAGMTTAEIDASARTYITDLGGEAVLVGYEGFPAAICVSVNDEVVHGIPGSRVLAEGDVVGLDLCVGFEGMITDSAITVPVGTATPDVERLLAATRQALSRGIARVHDGVRIGDISHAVETRLRADKLGIVRELAGHGVGHEVHEDPIILNFGKAGRGQALAAGMTIAIEPMASLGGGEVRVADDGWTVLMRDGSLAAHFEHTVLVTESGCEILTLV